jgi:dihydroorotase
MDALYIKISRARIIDPISQTDDIVDVGIQDGKLAKIGEVTDTMADKVVQLNKKILSPTLIDLHTHVYYLSTSMGVDVDALSARSGVGVFVDAGSAGAGNFLGFKEYVIRRANARVYSFLNIGFGGITYFGLSGGKQVGEIPDVSVADIASAEKCIEKNRDVIVGVKVRLSKNANGDLGAFPLRAAKKVARKFGLPVMLHFGKPPPTLFEMIPLLERGDILTHCFNHSSNSVVSEDTEGILNIVAKAKKRGVVFDVGHGMGSFSFSVAKRAVESGFFPDTISTDIHKFCIPSPVYDLPTTMTKFLNLGMPLSEILKATTYNPALAIGKSTQYGSIRVGNNAELVSLEVVKHETVLFDSYGKSIRATEIIEPSVLFRNGNPVKIDYIPFGKC